LIYAHIKLDLLLKIEIILLLYSYFLKVLKIPDNKKPL